MNIKMSINLIKLNKNLLTDWLIYYNKTEDGFFTNYSWYHIMWLIIMVTVSLILCLSFARRHDKKIDNRIIFGFGIFLIIIEIYKQIFITLINDSYQWSIFPFQFCSVPMYIAFLSGIIKKQKIKDAMYKFLSFFGLIAGLSVMLYPSSCFTTHYLSMLIHTMLWHSSMVIMGLYLIVSKEYCTNIRNILNELLPGLVIFILILITAITINVIGYNVYFKNTDQVLFLMYISPYYYSPLPILSVIKENTNYFVFLLSYINIFIIGITILWLLAYGIKSLSIAKLINKKEINKDNSKKDGKIQCNMV